MLTTDMREMTQTEYLGMKTIVCKVENALHGMRSKSDSAGEKIRKLRAYASTDCQID
jgi:hypothetical protein